MTWVKLDDGFHSNPKVIEAGLAAAGLYAMALSYCGDHHTDGVVPASWLARAGTPDLAHTLEENDLWEPIEKGARRHITRATGERVDIVASATGYFIRDYLQENPSAVEVQCRRSERAAAGRKGAQSRWKKPPEEQGEHGNSHSNSHSTPHRNRNPPDPALKDQKPLRGQTINPDDRSTWPECPHPGCRIQHHSHRRIAEHLTNAHWLQPHEILEIMGDDAPPEVREAAALEAAAAHGAVG